MLAKHAEACWQNMTNMLGKDDIWLNSPKNYGRIFQNMFAKHVLLVNFLFFPIPYVHRVCKDAMGSSPATE
jgi:hypothetical protein